MARAGLTSAASYHHGTQENGRCRNHQQRNGCDARSGIPRPAEAVELVAAASPVGDAYTRRLRWRWRWPPRPEAVTMAHSSPKLVPQMDQVVAMARASANLGGKLRSKRPRIQLESLHGVSVDLGGELQISLSEQQQRLTMETDTPWTLQELGSGRLKGFA
uniref:Uncharacterized protein n=1 Tax=Oryza glumipatula TaxID=40148 RepID=A0A0E0A7I8_9ORYZ